MGNSHSKHGHRKEPLSQADISTFVPRIRDMMSDSAYQSGVDLDSIIDMLNDIHDIYIGKSKYVRLPRPINGLAPAQSMRFSTSSRVQSEGLLRSNADSETVSRRTFSRRLSRVPEKSSYREPKYQPSQMNRSDDDMINVHIDDVIAYTEGIMHDHNSGNDMRSRSMEIPKDIPSPSPLNQTEQKPVTRPRVRRPVQ